MRVPWERALIPAVLVLLAGCSSSAAPTSAPVTNKTRPLIIAHRGARSLAPENTLAAARKALQAGADMWEMDVAVTSDGELIVVHDDTLERTCNVADLFPDRRPWNVWDFTLAEIQTLDCGSWFAARDPFGQIKAGNVSTEEAARYSPKKIDVIVLEETPFVTKDIRELLEEVGHEFPALTKVFSIYKEGLLQRPMGLATDIAKADAVVTFDGLIAGTPFMLQMEAILKTLSTAMGVPVDIEFASTGTDFYLLQCRPQSQASEDVAMEIPANLPDAAVLFTARKHVSNGRVADVTHVVYVDPDRYGELADYADLVAVGEAVGKLNKLLPRRQFLLMGPGRWGSRGDIKLGVRVTYSEINNSAMLIEVARKKGNYVPDVSFGTHFFQDLVESGIRYLPLYPDDEGVKFNERFLLEAPNKLAEHCPECAAVSHALRVIDIPEATGGKVLRVLMNADRELAVGFFAPPEAAVRTACESGPAGPREDEDAARWRQRMAERVAYHCGGQRWGVRGVYYLDESESAEIDPAAPIRLVLHFLGGGRQRKEIETWLQGWSLSLAEMNYFRTGFHSEGLLDVHFLTDEKVRGERDVAARLKVASDAVRELPLGPKAAA